jgi:hypothetical protein
MVIRASFARNRADLGGASGLQRHEKIARVPGGGPLHGLDRIRRDCPMALRGVSLSIEPIESHVKPL